MAVYSHAEFYPPTLNALHLLSPRFDKIYVLCRNVLVSTWKYPKNVELIVVSEFDTIDNTTKYSFVKKLWSYFQFGNKLRELTKIHKPSLVLVYDTIPFALYCLFKKRLPRKEPFVWYHNHDVTAKSELGKFSIAKLFLLIERKNFRKLDLFTLPTKARLEFFPVDKLRSQLVILPNYPSKTLFGKWRSETKAGEAFKIIFQGHISSLMDIEEFVKQLPHKVMDKQIELHLVGPISEQYKMKLLQQANELDVKKWLYIYGRIPYDQLPKLTASCHIGVAIYPPHNSMTRTMSTASNKIFEYASVGLPVLLNEREDFRTEFSSYRWIKFLKNIEINEIQVVLESLIQDYEFISEQAVKDFQRELNYEFVFGQVNNVLVEKLW